MNKAERKRIDLRLRILESKRDRRIAINSVNPVSEWIASSDNIDREVKANIDAFALNTHNGSYVSIDVIDGKIVLSAKNTELDELVGLFGDKYKEHIYDLFNINKEPDDENNISLLELISIFIEENVSGTTGGLITLNDEASISANALIAEMEACISILGVELNKSIGAKSTK